VFISGAPRGVETVTVVVTGARASKGPVK